MIKDQRSMLQFRVKRTNRPSLQGCGIIPSLVSAVGWVKDQCSKTKDQRSTFSGLNHRLLDSHRPLPAGRLLLVSESNLAN